MSNYSIPRYVRHLHVFVGKSVTKFLNFGYLTSGRMWGYVINLRGQKGPDNKFFLWKIGEIVWTEWGDLLTWDSNILLNCLSSDTPNIFSLGETQVIVDCRVFQVFSILQGHATVTLNGNQIPQGETAKYLDIYLDRRLTWRPRIFAERKQLGLKFQQMYRILGRKS
jgi:hypothetical protein